MVMVTWQVSIFGARSVGKDRVKVKQPIIGYFLIERQNASDWNQNFRYACFDFKTQHRSCKSVQLDIIWNLLI